MCRLYWILFSCSLNYFCRGQISSNRIGTSFQFQQNKYIRCSESPTTSIVRKSQIDCTKTCLQTDECVAIKYNKTSKLCSFCSHTDVTCVVSDTVQDETFSGIRRYFGWSPFTITPKDSKLLDIPCGLTIGNTIVLRGVYTATTGFILNLQLDPDNYLLHFRPIYTTITITHKRNKHFASGTSGTFTIYPFKVGSEFLLKILAQEDSLEMFVDGKKVGSYPYNFPVTSVRYIALQESLNVLQLSF